MRTGGVGSQSFSAGSSPSLSHDLNTTYDDEEEREEPHTQATLEHENSFEDLEQFLSQLDWAPGHGGPDEPGSDLELSSDASMQDEAQIQELEMRALTEHMKAIVKDIHIAIGESECI